LLAEDHPDNQRLAMRLLEKWGHSVVLANTGRKALEALEKERFDLVLMDVQMPEMGGYEATQCIREKETFTGGHIPIVAMTAHALKGDREQCLQSGMDDYITKPIDPSKLFSVLENYLAVKEEQPISVIANEPKVELAALPPPEPEHSTVDEQEIWKRVGGDRELLQELVGMFIAETPSMVDAIRSSLNDHKAEDLERSAHRLKGAVSNWGAQSAVALSLKLEQTGRKLKAQGESATPDSFEEAKKDFELLEKELNRVNLALESLRQKEAA
jgi:CheY-like chemotaxis protein